MFKYCLIFFILLASKNINSTKLFFWILFVDISFLGTFRPPATISFLHGAGVSAETETGTAETGPISDRNAQKSRDLFSLQNGLAPGGKNNVTMYAIHSFIYWHEKYVKLCSIKFFSRSHLIEILLGNRRRLIS